VAGCGGTYAIKGWKITSSWIDEDGEGETADFGKLWTRIDDEICASDALVLYAEPGDFPLKGALVEVGMAIANKKTVFVCLPGVEIEGRTAKPIGSWIFHSSVRLIWDLKELHQWK
jgi:hypothetical protein